MGSANRTSFSLDHYSSIKDTTCNKTVFMVNRVIKVSNESKECYNVKKSDEVWLIDSGASHHITNELSDYTSYKPYETPDPIQTANLHDSLMVHGEGTVFFDTKTTNGQIHKVHLDNVCYIPNGSNRLISRGQLCKSGLIEVADNKSTTFLLPTGHIFLWGFPRNEQDTLHWVQSMIAHPNVPMAEPSVYLVNYKIWHERMGHPSKNVLKHIGQNTNGFTPDIVFPVDVL